MYQVKNKVKQERWEDMLTNSYPDDYMNSTKNIDSKFSSVIGTFKKINKQKTSKPTMIVENQNETSQLVSVLESRLVNEKLNERVNEKDNESKGPDRLRDPEKSKPNFRTTANDQKTEFRKYKEPREEEYICPYEHDFFNRINFNFPHKIYKCPDTGLPSAENVLDILKHLALVCKNQYNFDPNNSGASIIIGPKFICFVPYNKEYRLHYNMKLFTDPWNYLNFFTMPELCRQFPETANLKDAHSPIEVQNYMELLTKVYVDKGIEVNQYKSDDEGDETYHLDSNARFAASLNGF